MEGYIAIDPTNAGWRLRLDDARSRARALSAATPPAAPPPAQRAAPGVGNLLAAAHRYMEHEDYATAYAFALRAEGIDPGSRDAVALRLRAAEALARLGPDAAGQAAIALYKVKESGTAALRNDPVAAYYILKRGAEAHPGDRELLELLAAAEAGLAPLAFFRDTVPDPQQVPRRDRVERVAFVNRREPGLVEIVCAGSVVRVPRTTHRDAREGRRLAVQFAAARSSRSRSTTSRSSPSAPAASPTTCAHRWAA